MVEDVRAATLHYLEVYFRQRDLAATASLFDPAITVIGTGQSEVGLGRESVLRLYERDVQDVPNPVEYALSWLEAFEPQPGTGLAAAELDIWTVIANQAVRINRLRLSLMWVWKDSAWRIAHMHVSLPSQIQQGSEPYPILELEERNRVLQRLADEKTQALQMALLDIQRLAAIDKLTQVMNRSRIEEFLEQQLLRSQRYANPFAVILVDLDYFKNVNDRYGHLAGDQVLAELASLLVHRARRTDGVGRWGGEEFLVVCPETPLDAAARLAEHLRQQIEEKPFGGGFALTASLGLTAYHRHDTRDAILSRVDQALYAAKHAGRNRAVQIP